MVTEWPIDRDGDNEKPESEKIAMYVQRMGKDAGETECNRATENSKEKIDIEIKRNRSCLKLANSSEKSESEG